MSVVALVLAAAMARPASSEPVLWLNPAGQLLIGGREARGRLNAGAKTVQTPAGLGLDFSGGKSGFLIPDFPLLHLTRSMTVATWLYLRSYTPNGFQSQILFRGDDRSGLDPYHLSVESDGTVGFSIDSADGGQASVKANIPLKTWIRVTGSYDEETNEMRLYIGTRLAATVETPKHPFAELEAKSIPGVSIGNVQNDKGPHNQPLDGIVVDLRLYDEALTPKAAGYSTVFSGAG